MVGKWLNFWCPSIESERYLIRNLLVSNFTRYFVIKFTFSLSPLCDLSRIKHFGTFSCRISHLYEVIRTDSTFYMGSWKKSMCTAIYCVDRAPTCENGYNVFHSSEYSRKVQGIKMVKLTNNSNCIAEIVKLIKAIKRYLILKVSLWELTLCSLK